MVIKQPFFQICLTLYVCRLSGSNIYSSSFRTQFFFAIHFFCQQISEIIHSFLCTYVSFSTCSFLPVLCASLNGTIIHQQLKSETWELYSGSSFQHPKSSLTFNSVNFISQIHSFVSNTNATVWGKRLSALFTWIAIAQTFQPPDQYPASTLFTSQFFTISIRYVKWKLMAERGIS